MDMTVRELLDRVREAPEGQPVTVVDKEHNDEAFVVMQYNDFQNLKTAFESLKSAFEGIKVIDPDDPGESHKVVI